MLSKWWHPQQDKPTPSSGHVPQDPGSCPSLQEEPTPAEPGFPASLTAGTIRCFTPKLTRGHSCDILEGQPARAPSQSWQTLLAISVQGTTETAACPALQLW